MTQIKEARIRAYDNTNNEDTNYVVSILPATGTNNNQRIDIRIEQLSPAVTITVSVNYSELQSALSVIKF